MRSKIVETTQRSHFNWGKFLVCEFTEEEWGYRSRVDETTTLMRACGWRPGILLVVDLQTGEGAVFTPGGSAHADLEKRRVWVCVMFEDFLKYLYGQPQPLELDALPDLVYLDTPGDLYGYRRPGPSEEISDNHPTATDDACVRRHGDDGPTATRIAS